MTTRSATRHRHPAAAHRVRGRPIPPWLHLLAGVLATCLPGLLAGCGGGGGGAPHVDEGNFAQCHFDAAASAEPERHRALFAVARGGGIIAAASPASTWIAQQTDDGYWLRGGLATVLMTSGFLVSGALGGALILALRRRKPRPAWGDELHRRFLDELRMIRALGHDDPKSDALVAIVARFSEALDQMQARAKTLVERCHTLQTRNDSTTARAHLVNAEDDLGRLLQKLETLHFEILAWQDRAETLDDGSVDDAMAARLKSLRDALEATV